MVGSSSRDIHQSGSFDVQGGSLVGEIIQAETASLMGGAQIATNYVGYTGSGFVDGLQEEGAAVSFQVNVSAAGQYTATLRYGNTLRPGEQNTPRTLNLYVNGTRIGQTSLPNLANWEMWDFKADNITLNAGDNTIVYQFDAGDTGDVHLDALLLVKAIEPEPVPTVTAIPSLTPTNIDQVVSTPAETTSFSWILPVAVGGLVVVVIFMGWRVIMTRQK